MTTAGYSAQELAKRVGLPVALVHYYAQLGLLDEKESSASLCNGIELVDSDTFIQCAAEAGLTHEEMACLLTLNERADQQALILAATKLLDMIKQHRCIIQLQSQLETWLFEYSDAMSTQSNNGL